MRIDDTAPVTSDDAPDGLGQRSGRRSRSSSDDALSGVEHLLRHRRRRAGRSTTGPFEIIGEGTTTIEYYSVDVVGNTEDANTATRAHRRHGAGDAVTTHRRAWVNGPVDVTLDQR